jgi:peptidoglycan hydrolase CwlO-like protein
MTMTSKFVISLSLMMVITFIGFWVAADQEWIHSRLDNHSSQYHHVLQEIQRLDAEIKAYETKMEPKLAEHEAFARKLIEFYRHHKENLEYNMGKEH